MLDDGVKEVIFSWDVHFTRFDGDFLHVTIVDLIAVGCDQDGAAAVEAANVAAGGGDKDAADFGVAVGFGVGKGVMHAFSGNRQIDNFPLTHTARRSEAYAEDPECAFTPDLAHDDADL